MEGVGTCSCGKAGPRIDESAQARLSEIIRRHEGRPGALIPVLHEAQDLVGYLPAPVQAAIAAGLGVPLSEVYGVVTFYSYFTMVPRGLHVVRICLGTACYVRGAGRLVEQIERELSISVPGTTEDGLFTVETVRCLGACSLAPVMVIDDDIYRQVKPKEIGRLLSRYSGEPAAEPARVR